MICRHPVHKIEWAEAVGYDFEMETWMEDHAPGPESGYAQMGLEL